jgi:hypothetical protein
LKNRVHPADIHDRAGAELLLEGLQHLFPAIKRMWADTAYRGLKDWLRNALGWQTVCSLPAGWLVHTMQLRGLRRMGRRRASRTGDEPCSRRAKCLSVWIPPS